MKRSSLIWPLVLLVFVFACTMPAPAPQAAGDPLATQAPETATAAASQTGNGSATATSIAASPTATSTQAPAPSATNTPLPCNQVSFVSDVTVPDDTDIQINSFFTKTWRLKNVGSCTWTSGYQLVFDSGDQMGGPASQQLTNGTVGPGETVDVSVNLAAPGSAGTYKGYWKIREPGGAVFGLSSGPFWVQIHAFAPAEAQWPLVKIGDSGAVVRAVQYLLKAQGEALDVDGDFGPITKSKVQDFQSDHGLHVDGIVGPETWPVLIIQVHEGSHGDAVRAVQIILKQKIGVGLDVDGIFGNQTDHAVRGFQEYYGLTQDGIVGPITWRFLVDPDIGLYPY